MNETTVSTLVVRYIQAAAAEEGKSRTTIKSYQNRLRIFAAWLGPEAQLSTITLPVLYDFLYHIRDRKNKAGQPISKTTSITFFNALRAFGEWLVQHGRWQENIVKGVKLPKAEDPKRKMVSDVIVRDLLNTSPNIYPARRGAMAALVVRLLCYTGIRRAELLNLKPVDFSLHDNTLKIWNGKGDKHRTLGLHPEVRSAYIKWMHHRGLCVSGYLLTVDTFRCLGDNGLRNLLQEIETVAGHPGSGITCHPLRHNFATYSHFVAKDPLRVTQEALGHSRLSTTEIYVEGGRSQRVIDAMQKSPSRDQQKVLPIRKRRSLRG